jgi:NAD+ synthase
MAETLRIALAQINPHLGDIRANAARIRRARTKAAAGGADLVVTPEFSIAGHPPEDLARRPEFLADCAAAIAGLAVETGDGGPGLVVGGPWQDGRKLHNALFLLEGGRIQARRAKHELPPDGGAFDAGPAPGPVAFRGIRLGLMIGEDWWSAAVPETLAESGAEILLSINGAPFEAGRTHARMDLAVHRVVETGLPFVFHNQIGGQDELVFDGGGFVLNADRSPALQMPRFEEVIAVTEWRRDGGRLACVPQPLPPEVPPLEQIYHALMLGLRDQVEKNRFPGVILGLSGGIGSALAAAVAVDALGPGRVRAVAMPSPGTDRERLADAADCARLLGIRIETVPVGPAAGAIRSVLAPLLSGGPPAAAAEWGIRSRARGLALTMLAEAAGELLLATVTRTELSVGCATPHGDLCGDFAVLKDIDRTRAAELCRWRNSHSPPGARGPQGAVVPERILARPRPTGREDDASLPPPEVLDAILAGLVEDGKGADALVAEGHDRAAVLHVRRLLDRAERKRRQAPPGVTLGPRAFGRGRRTPITNGYTEFFA